MIAILIRLLLSALFLGFCSLVGQSVWPVRGNAWGIALGALIMLAYQFASAQRLMRWVSDLRLDNMPTLSGWWEDIGAKIYRNLRLNQRQQQALANALISFRSAAQALPDGVVTLDSDLRIQWCNETAEDHFGIKLGTDIGQRLINLVRSPEFSDYLGHLQWDKPLVIRAPKQNHRFISLQMVRYGDQQSLVLTRDITQLEKLERMRRDFVANVSHELKTPLTVLSGFLETMQDIPLEEEQRNKYLQMMFDQALRMQRLVEDLLTLSSLESGNQQPVDDIIHTAPLFERMETEAKGLSGGRHSIRFECDTHINIKGAETEIASAFSNLVSNAIRYTPPAGIIVVRWGVDDQGRGRFEVQDSGIGIEPTHIPRLTERFYRVDRGRSRDSGGTGLGLAIVKHVMTRHGGMLDIKSELGKGSKFVALLPAKRLVHSNHGAPSDKDVPPLSYGLKPPTIKIAPPS